MFHFQNASHCIVPNLSIVYRKCGGRERDEARVCGGHEHIGMAKRIVYAWALDAPSKKLPEGVGLRVGGDTDIQYMVLQLHYKTTFSSMF